MKPPSSWTPDEAKEVEDYLRESPDDTQAAQQYLLYKQKQNERAGYDKSTSFKPEHNPGGMVGLKMLLPMGLGGSSRNFYEPTKEEFSAAVKLAPGEDPAQAYQDFKDAEWSKAVAHARDMGLPIVRVGATEAEHNKVDAQVGQAETNMTKHALSENLAKPALGLLTKGLTGFTLPNADKALEAGLEKVGAPGAADYLRSAEEKVGPVGTAAEIGGAMMPGSILGKLGGSIARALGPSKTILGGLAKGAGTGAATATVAGSAGDALGAVGNGAPGDVVDNDKYKMTGIVQPSEGISKDVLADMAMKTPGRMLVGSLLGLLPGASSGLRGANRNLAGNAGQREFAAIEAAGGSGLKTPPGVAAVEPKLYEHPTDIIIEQAAPKIAKAVLARVKPPTPVSDTMSVSARDLMPEGTDPEELVRTATGLEPITHRGTAWAHSERSPGPPPSGAEPTPTDTLREPPATVKEPVTPVQPAKNSSTAHAKTLPSGGAPSTSASPRSDMNKQLDEVSRLLKGAGIKTFDMDPNNPELLQEIRQALHKAHFGEGSTEHNRALQALAGNDPEAVKALADVLAAKAVAKGATEGGIPGVPINPLRWPGAVASAASKNRYRMDPIAGFLANRIGMTGEAPKVADPLTQALIDLQTRSNHP